MLRAGCAERYIVLETLKRFGKFYCVGPTRETLSSVTLRTESRDECNWSRYWTLVLSSGKWNFRVLLCIRWRISTCSETALRNYQQTLALLTFCVASNLASISSDQVPFGSKKNLYGN